MHPIISAAVAAERHAELLRRAGPDRTGRAAGHLPARAGRADTAPRVPAWVAVLRGWLARG